MNVYIQQLCQDHQLLVQLREVLRRMMKQSALMDSAQYMRDLEDVYMSFS